MRDDDEDSATAVARLYRENAIAMIRLAHIMLGNRAAAEDVVQEAFIGLYRRYDQLTDKDRAVAYVRSSVLNGCRSHARRNRHADLRQLSHPDHESAEATVMTIEQRRAVVDALRQLPQRQREALVLRYYLDLSYAEIARDMGISPVGARSTAHRGIAALGRALGVRA